MKQPLDDPIAEEAIKWLVLMRSGLASDFDRERFAAWQKADPAHAAAVQRLQGGLNSLTLASMPAPHRDAARHLLDTPPSRMRHVRRALALGGIGIGIAALVDLQIPLSCLGADMHTATSERRDFKLADGSLLRLNARSAADASVNVGVADVRLRRGSVLAVAASPVARVRVLTAAGSIECEGGMVCATLERGGTMRVAVLEGTAWVATFAGEVSTLRAGEVRRLSQKGIQPLDLLARSAAAWTRGLVEVVHQPLANVVDALRPYHPGLIELHSDAAALRVTGRFPLDVGRALQMLAETLPIQVRELGGLWVRIAAR